MRQLFSFLKKEILHIIRDKRTILILLILPVVQISLFGFAMTLEVKNVNLAVKYSYGDAYVEQIISRIEASEYFKIIKLVNTPDDMDKALKRENIDSILVFEDGFSEMLFRGEKPTIQIINDATDPNQASTITTYIQGILSGFQREIIPELIFAGIAKPNPITINTELKMLYNPELKGSYNFVPGVMSLVLTLICALMTSISIVREKETGTMELLLVSPMKPIYIIISKITPYFIISTINLVTILFLAVNFLDMPIRGSLTLLIALSFLFISLSLTVGIVISSLVANQAAAMLIAGMALMMPVMLLSGMLFPKDSMPYFIQLLTYLVPASWYFEAVKKIMIEGLGISSIIKEGIVLTTMFFTLIIVSVLKFKNRLG